MEREIKIVLVPKEQIYENTNMIRISCKGMNDGWGETIGEAIQNFDKVNKIRYGLDLSKI